MNLCLQVALLARGYGWPVEPREHALEEGLFEVPGWLPGAHYAFGGLLTGSAHRQRNVRARARLDFRAGRVPGSDER